TAPTSRRPTRQRTQQELEEAARRYLARRKREDGEGSRRGVESRNRGSREAVDEDGEDDDVHHAQVEPQQPQSTRQTAVNEAADTTDPHANSAGPAVPVGTTNEPSNGIDEGEKGGEEDEKGEWASGIETPSSNDDGGDEDVRHAPPPSVPLEGEEDDQKASGHVDDMATHLKPTPDQSTTTPPLRTPYDQGSNGEGRKGAVGGDDEVEGSEDKRNASYGDDERRCRREKARDEATGDEEGREVEERSNEGEEGRTSVQARSTTNVDGHGQYTPNEGNSPQEPPPPFPHHPEPPPVPTPTPPAPAPTALPPHPERHDDVDHTKSNKTAARARADALHNQEGETVSPGSVPPSVRLEGESGRRSSLHAETDDVETDDLKTCKTAAQRMCADALHDPGGQTDAPDSVPPSVRLEGERNRLTSLYVEVDHVETDDDHAEDDDHAQQPSRHPVGTPDGDERRPSEPTEPPDEKDGEREVDGELGVKSKVKTRVETVKGVEPNASRRVDEPGDEGNEESRSREVEGEARGQSEGDDCQRDGRTNDTGDATSSASCDSLRVETGALAEHEDGQQQNGTQNVSTNVPTPPTPLPYDTKRPTHHANPPRRRGRLKSPPTKVSQARAYGLRTKSDGHTDHLPVQSDATETVRSYRGSVPKPPQSRTKGTEARTSTPHTVDITHTRELPYRVITPA
ncbi:hypothetical protein PAXINDRAFT_21725, partial [Paxillus involutus ATCC 200175]